MTEKIMEELKEKGRKVVEIVKEKAKGISIGDVLLYSGLAVGGITLFSLVSGIKPKPPVVPPNYTILDWENKYGNALEVVMEEPKSGTVITGSPLGLLNTIHFRFKLRNKSPYMLPSGKITIYAVQSGEPPLLCPTEHEGPKMTCDIISADFPGIPPGKTITLTASMQWMSKTPELIIIHGPTVTVNIFAKSEYAGVKHDLGSLGTINLEYAW